MPDENKEEPKKSKPNPMQGLDSHAGDHIHLTFMVYLAAATLVLTLIAYRFHHEIKSFLQMINH